MNLCNYAREKTSFLQTQCSLHSLHTFSSPRVQAILRVEVWICVQRENPALTQNSDHILQKWQHPCVSFIHKGMTMHNVAPKNAGQRNILKSRQKGQVGCTLQKLLFQIATCRCSFWAMGQHLQQKAKHAVPSQILSTQAAEIPFSRLLKCTNSISFPTWGWFGRTRSSRLVVYLLDMSLQKSDWLPKNTKKSTRKLSQIGLTQTLGRTRKSPRDRDAHDMIST